MNFQFKKNGDTFEFSGSVSAHDMQKLKLDAFDRALLNDKTESASDHLLVLEMIFRRHEQGLTHEKPEQADKEVHQ